MIRKLLLLTGLFIVISAGSAAWAQDGLSADEQILVARAVAALDAVTTYQSYVVTQIVQESTFVALKNGDTQLQTTSNDFSSDSTLTVVHSGDDAQAARTTTLTQVRGDESIMLSGELRLVDGVLYAMLDRLDEDEETDNRWRIIEDINITGIFSVLDPASFLDVARGVQNSIVDDMAFLTAFITSVEQTMSQDADGSPLEIITLQMDANALSAFFLAAALAEGTTPEATIFDFLSENSGQQIVLFLDDEGRLRQIVNTTVLNADDREAQLIFPQARDGMTVDFRSTNAEITRISRINESLEAVDVPEIDQSSESSE